VAPSAQDLQRADEALVAKFTWPMNAATSRLGLFCDLVFAFALAACAGFLFVISAHFRSIALASVLGVLTVAPLIVWLVGNLALRNARRGVVQWIASLPFPVENLNAVLLGMGETFELHFLSEVPPRSVVMDHFAAVSDDAFVLEVRDEQKMVLSRFGVVVSKHNPHGGAYARYALLRQLVGRSLIELHHDFPIARLQII
jgi:hypothetical protein